MSDPKTVLIVDDSFVSRLWVETFLKQQYSNWNVIIAEGGKDALMKTESVQLDLAILDINMPEMDGFTLGSEVRLLDRKVPLLFLSAKSMKEDKLKGFDVGADDYITKPFSTKELLARIRAVLRRSDQDKAQGLIQVEGLTLDPETYRVTANEETIEISPTEFRLLQFFITHPERVYSRTQLLDQVWGQNVYVEERTVDVHIRRLRQTLAPYNYDKFIQTVRSVGYRFSSK